jgi:hypothetical protein
MLDAITAGSVQTDSMKRSLRPGSRLMRASSAFRRARVELVASARFKGVPLARKRLEIRRRENKLLTVDADVPSLLEPLDQILEAVGRHPLAGFRGLGIVVVEEVGRLILLATRLFGHLAVHGAAVLADIEDLAFDNVRLAKEGRLRYARRSP